MQLRGFVTGDNYREVAGLISDLGADVWVMRDDEPEAAKTVVRVYCQDTPAPGVDIVVEYDRGELRLPVHFSNDRPAANILAIRDLTDDYRVVIEFAYSQQLRLHLWVTAPLKQTPGGFATHWMLWRRQAAS